MQDASDSEREYELWKIPGSDEEERFLVRSGPHLRSESAILGLHLRISP